MLHPKRLIIHALALSPALAQISSTTSISPTVSSSTSPSLSSSPTPTLDLPSSVTSISTISTGEASIPTGSYQTATSQITLSTLTPSLNTTNPTTTNPFLLSGTTTTTTTTTTTNPTSPPTSSLSPTPSNTQPCNNYPELCNRQYMSTTEVCTHNSAFIRPNNAASNQAYSITAQLNDGVRMLQGETHWVNDTLYSCHTSCDLLNAGPLQSQLTTIAAWVRSHPYDVVTILLVNSDFRNVTDYIAPIVASSLQPYLFIPPKFPMHTSDWPTLGDLILAGTRVVLFLDYQADQTTVPYVLDQFSQMWETPFSPTDPSFPCTQQRPPGLDAEQQALVPYLANHNLNVEVSLGSSTTLMIPNFATLDAVNSADEAGSNGSMSLASMADNCTRQWGRPPAWLLVDFYERGSNPGDVFAVAAKMNGVNYTGYGSCCGMEAEAVSGASETPMSSIDAAMVVVAVVGFLGI